MFEQYSRLGITWETQIHKPFEDERYFLGRNSPSFLAAEDAKAIICLCKYRMCLTVTARRLKESLYFKARPLENSAIIT